MEGPCVFDLQTDFHTFLQPFEYFEIELLVSSLPGEHKLLMHYPFAIKKANDHRFDFGLAHSCLFWS